MLDETKFDAKAVAYLNETLMLAFACHANDPQNDQFVHQVQRG